MSKLKDVLVGFKRIPKVVVFDIGKSTVQSAKLAIYFTTLIRRLYAVAVSYRLLWNSAIYTRRVNHTKISSSIYPVLFILLFDQ